MSSEAKIPPCYEVMKLESLISADLQMLTMIEVFKTNVELEDQSERILASLIQMFSSLKINFDLDDCDKILRVEGHEFSVDRIRETIHALGYTCEVLE